MLKSEFPDTFTYYKLLLKLLLGLYLVALCWVLFFQVGPTDRNTYFVNPDDHLLPFHSTYEMLKKAITYHATPHGGEFRNIFLVNIFGNLILLLPWGFLAPLVMPQLNQLKKVALSGFIISFAAEALQYTFTLGIADVDDLMYNTLGAIAGFYLLQVVKFLWTQTRSLRLDEAGGEKLDQKSI